MIASPTSVVDNSSGKTVWCSGCTNEPGVITNGGGSQSERLPSELFDVYQDGRFEVPLQGLNAGNLTVKATLYYQSIPLIILTTVSGKLRTSRQHNVSTI